ncbi:hypothetical protein Trydic_g16077 [Trypoxylus dichotomus]
MDQYQPPEQAGFRKVCTTIEHIHTMRTLIETCNEHNVLLRVAFDNYNKVSDSIEIWVILTAMDQESIQDIGTTFVLRTIVLISPNAGRDPKIPINLKETNWSGRCHGKNGKE